MALIKNGKPVIDIPRENDYKRWKGLLDDSEYQTIKYYFKVIIENAGVIISREVVQTALKTITSKSIRDKIGRKEMGKCFGLFLYVELMGRDEEWDVKKTDRGNVFKRIGGN